MNTPINVFIDTSIFRRNGFLVDKTMFRTLQSLCDSKKIQLILTDITNKEIESNILKSIEELKTEFKIIAKANRIIETIGGDAYNNFLDSKTTEETLKEIKKTVDDFFKSCNALTINASKQSANQIFKDYFLKRPPFGKGKKNMSSPMPLCFRHSKNGLLKKILK